MLPVALVVIAVIALLGDRHPAWVHQCGEKAYISLRLADSPQPYPKSIRAKAQVLAVDGRTIQGDIYVYLRPDSTAHTLRYGDRLLIHGYPDTVRHSIYTTSDHYIITSRDSTSLRARSEAIRLRLLRRMQHGPLPRREAGVAEALTLGWRADIEPETRSTYRSAGIAHLLAVSGLHVGLLSAIVGMLLIWLGRERRGRAIRGSIQLLSVWAFTLLTGLAPSTVRAALMFSLFIIADIDGRRTPKLNLLAAAAIFTLLAKPTLLFDTGWQLSYSAVAGILIARPLITACRNRLVQAATVSTVATVATLPVSLAVFHRFYPYFLIANVLIVPLAGVILMLSLLYMALPTSLTAWPLDLILRGVEALTSWIASLPGAVIKW